MEEFLQWRLENTTAQGHVAPQHVLTPPTPGDQAALQGDPGRWLRRSARLSLSSPRAAKVIIENTGRTTRCMSLESSLLVAGCDLNFYKRWGLCSIRRSRSEFVATLFFSLPWVSGREMPSGTRPQHPWRRQTVVMWLAPGDVAESTG